MTTTRTRLTGPMSQRLRTARVGAGLTQQNIADQLGIALKSVSNYENPNYSGARKPIVIRAWAAACDRAYEELWPQRDVEVRRRACNGQTPPAGARSARPAPVAA